MRSAVALGLATLGLQPLGLGMTRGGGGAYSPASALFAAGEQGVWYDFSDLSTMFQDTAGTTPVTAVGQRIALLLDKSRGLVPEAELVPDSGFDTPAAWTPQDANWVVSGGKATYADIGLSYLESAASISITSGRWYVCRFTISGATPAVNAALLSVFNKAATINYWGAYQTFTNNGEYTVYFQAAASSTGIRIYGNGSSIAGWSLESFSIKELPGNHATRTTTAQQPILRQTGGGLYYAEFDGIDDSWVTGNIDFSATDEMTVIAGLRKLSDAASAMLVELSSSWAANTGAFFLHAPETGGVGTYSSGSRGTAGLNLNQRVIFNSTAPDTRVVTSTHDISGDLTVGRMDGVQQGTATGDKGAGNFGNYPLFVGRRGGTSLPFNGHLFGMIVRGKTTSGTDLTNAETYMAGKTGVTL